MDSKIRILSEHTINQIAAGEVIENPASIVKELVENAIDAGAQKVIVEILSGGLQKIRVSDDGSGMSRDDAILCLERHATSKIVAAEDLNTVVTMGFRGEALASIAAVSKMSIETALADQIGTKIEIEAGRIKDIQSCARNKGTTVEVRQLFFNVPARKKFQKSPSLSAADITRTLTSLSLANPLISFELYQHERLIFSLKGDLQGAFLQRLQERVSQTLGDSFLEGALLLDAEISSFRFQGIIGSVQNTRANRVLQYQFINRRSVYCPLVSYAVKDAFGTRIPENRHPVFTLHIEIPHALVDVNVHPQKKEVRLREEAWIKTQLQEQVQSLFKGKEGGSAYVPTISNFSFAMFPHKKEKKEGYSWIEMPEGVGSSSVMNEESSVEQLPLTSFSLHPVGFFSHYVFFEADPYHFLWPLIVKGSSKPGLFICDLELASARILYDALRSSHPQHTRMQGLLFPLTFVCSIEEAERIQLHMDTWQKMGFSLHASGKSSFLIEAIPSMLQDNEAIEVLRAAVGEQSYFDKEEEKQISWEERMERRFASVCTRLVQARKKTWNMEEAKAVTLELCKTSSPVYCPIGNKIITHLGEDELQELFSEKKK